jgi:hypothetical protein
MKRHLERLAPLAAAALIIVCAASAAAQELTFEFRMIVQGQASDWHMFGLREDAVQGVDQYDLPEPPPLPEAAFRSYLAMFEPLAGLPNRWLHDFRPVDGVTLDRVEIWQIVLESSALGQPCTVELRAPDPIGVPYDLFFFGPQVYFQRVTVPGTISFTIDSPAMVNFLELRLDDSVAEEAETWGGVKALFR